MAAPYDVIDDVINSRISFFFIATDHNFLSIFMIPDGNESLGPKFHEQSFFYIFVGSMTLSIYQYLLITYDVIDDVIEVGAPKTNMIWNRLIKTQI